MNRDALVPARLRAWRDRLLRETYTPPFPQHLPSNVATFTAVEPVRKILWRRLRRSLWLAANGQARLERQRIAPTDRRILWIHRGHPQVGDSLMDMACRTLLRGRPGRIDLLTDAHLVALYAADDVLARVYGDADEAAADAYDLVIVLSASAQSLRDKLRCFRRLPYVNLHGYYTGPEFHRMLFGFYRLAQLLGLHLSEAEVDRMACQHLIVGEAARLAVDSIGLPTHFIAIGVGGVHAWRTYRHWPAVLESLARCGVDLPVVLLGSTNGRTMRDAIVAAADPVAAGAPIDRVDRHALPEAAEILRRSQLAICCDGGLLHVAHAVRAPTVSLFAERVEPAYRLTAANRSIALYAPTEVSDIAPQVVAQTIARALSQGIEGISVRRV